MSNLKILGKDTAIYGFGQVLKKLIGFALIPIYTRALSPIEYGVLDSISTMSYFLTVILGFGMVGATGRYFFIAENELEKSKVLFTGLIIMLIINVIPVLFILPFSKNISSLLFGHGDYMWVVFLSILAIPITNLSSLQEVLFRYYRKPWKYLTVSVLKSIVTPGFGVLFVVIWQWGVFGVTLGTMFSSTTILLFAYIYYTRKKYVHKFSWVWAIKMIRFGYPLIFLGMMLWVNNVSDRFFLLHYSTLDQIGLYSIGNTFATPINLINLALTMSSTVLIMSLYSEETDEYKPRTKEFITKIWYAYLSIGFLVGIGISVFAYEIVFYITTPEYIYGILSIPFLIFSSILYQSSQIVCGGMSLKENNKPYLVSMIISASINVLLNFYFVPKWGFVGASITTLISNFVYFTMTYVWSEKYFRIKPRLILPIIFFIISLATSIYFPFSQIYLGMYFPFWFKILVMLTVLFSPFLFRLIDYNLIRNTFRQLTIKSTQKPFSN